MDMLLTDSDWETFSESGSSEEQEDTEFLYGGRACTILSSLEESIGKIDDLLSFERGFFHGDIVRSVTDPCGQMGRVVDIDMFVDLETVNGKVIKDINSNQLLKIRSISVGDYVVNSTWIGKVDKVVDRVTIVFDDGSKCEVTAMGQDKLVPVSPNIIDDSQYPYYPGQRVRVVPSDYSSSTGWLCGTWRENRDEGTVSSVEAGFVYVDWISSAHLDHDMSASPPSHLQEAKDLTLLVSFPHANWQLGDWCMLSFADGKGTSRKFLHASTHDLINGNWKLEKGFKIRNPGSRPEELFVIIKTRTKVNVTWQDVAPYEISRIDKCEGSATTPGLYEENTEDFNQEMFVHETQPNSHKGKELLSFDSAHGSGEKFSWAPASFFRPQAAIELFSSIVSGFLGSLAPVTLLSQESSSFISHSAKEDDILLEKEVSETCNDSAELDPSEMQIFETTNIKQEVEEIEENNMMPRLDETSGRYRQFDMVSDCSDHHFLGESKVLAVSQVKRSWVKKVQQEWSILEKNLPEIIYVRVYEERMDLLRAVLVGAPGTPYHDGLFFFDIFLPSNYPYEPPLVHYHSWGLRLNPNLYESGKVCLSLLNTWTGSDTEVWNPGSSSILQVLLSLQALVLNEKPYFNEAGYDKQLGRAEGETNSVSYNENAFLVTCQSMLYVLRKPPKHFEALVKEHFSKHAETIITACNAYMEGAPVGYALKCGKKDRDENFKGSSTGFKIMLSKLLPKLVEAFSDQGIDCSQFRGLNK
ncbi:hypothetical protein GOBAR_AA25250 [Gossypium barbadense]|uniref:E2 ubiquitin-conjugating enzyme n=1 Tax=Gossypium barbadense TaxID=3634 RepID=A0A2P5WWF9_GOSBA|nr:hypothetical protein GOBAR_AA25250 [Gossypium barbadense]